MTDIKKIRTAYLCGVVSLCLLLLLNHAAECLEVSDVHFEQKPSDTHGTVVEITYTLNSVSEECEVRVFFSSDGGANYNHQLSSPHVTGDIGSRIVPGENKRIEWAVLNEFPDTLLDNVRFKIEVDDGFVIPGLQVQMVDVPGGTFQLGDNSVVNSEPAHQVTLSPYQISKYPITNGQFAVLLNWAYENNRLKNLDGTAWAGTGAIYAGVNPPRFIVNMPHPSCLLKFEEGKFMPIIRESYPMDDYPVVYVSWYGGVAFCNWLSELSGLAPCYSMNDGFWTLIKAPPTIAGFRLPTEAEWEYAASWDATAGIKYDYGISSGHLGGTARCNFRLTEYIYVNPMGFTSPPFLSPVGWFNGINISPNGNVQTIDSPSPVGCYDMSGNVWEWTQDTYGPYTSTPKVNPLGASSGEYKILRGGSAQEHDFNVHTARRWFYLTFPDYTERDLGFRIVRSQ